MCKFHSACVLDLRRAICVLPSLNHALAHASVLSEHAEVKGSVNGGQADKGRLRRRRRELLEVAYMTFDFYAMFLPLDVMI